MNKVDALLRAILVQHGSTAVADIARKWGRSRAHARLRVQVPAAMNAIAQKCSTVG